MFASCTRRTSSTLNWGHDLRPNPPTEVSTTVVDQPRPDPSMQCTGHCALYLGCRRNFSVAVSCAVLTDCWACDGKGPSESFDKSRISRCRQSFQFRYSLDSQYCRPARCLLVREKNCIDCGPRITPSEPKGTMDIALARCQGQRSIVRISCGFHADKIGSTAGLMPLDACDQASLNSLVELSKQMVGTRPCRAPKIGG